jgi:hypothetical protein
MHALDRIKGEVLEGQQHALQSRTLLLIASARVQAVFEFGQADGGESHTPAFAHLTAAAVADA